MSGYENRPGCLGFLFKAIAGLFGEGGRKSGDQFPFRLRDDFLSPAEYSFYKVLVLAVGDQAIVCPKVSLADIFYVTRPNENYGQLNKIARKHVDFLLCTPVTMKPIAGIELDDKSHGREDRQERDLFVDSVFAAAGLPIIRVPAKGSYNVNELGDMLRRYLRDSKQDLPEAAEVGNTCSAQTEIPVCPKCNVPMVARTASRGSNKGEAFYGCPNYPKCRHTAPASKAAI